MAIRYSVTIDVNDDGSHTGPREQVISHVSAIEWRLGMTAPFDSIAAPASAIITLRNRRRAFSPELTPLVTGSQLRIESHDGAVTRTHFTGAVDAIKPDPGDQGKRGARIHASGLMTELRANRLQLPPQVRVTADQAIRAILLAAQIRRRALHGYMIIGVPGFNIIGQRRILGAFSAIELEAGKSTFAFVGDTWRQGVKALDAIAELAASERGRFFINRAGEAVFYNRHRAIANPTVAATFHDDMEDLRYRFGADVVNTIEVSIRPRAVGPRRSRLWTLNRVQRLPPNSARRIVAHYRDPNGVPIGAIDVDPIREKRGHFRVNTRQDNTGADATAAVRVTLIDAGMSAATIEIDNMSPATLYLHELTLYGRPLLGGDPITLIHTDAASATFYGLRTLRLDLPALSALDEADQVARYELERRKDPAGIALSLETSTRSHPQETLALTLFDQIRVVESQTGHDARYIIIGESHRVDRAGTRHRVRWTLERADSERFFVVGLHKPDGSRVLAF